MTLYLLGETAHDRLQKAVEAGNLPSADAEASFLSIQDAASSDFASREGSVGHINISGVLTKNPSLFAQIFGDGNTTYADISRALQDFQADDAVESVELHIDSPGGTVDGLFDALADMQAFSKPMKAVVGNQALSAAYAIATQADSIRATNAAARFGSVGVVQRMYVSKSEVSITSTNAPNKRPDVSTEEGRAAIVSELDALHDVFVEAIATGRGVPVDRVNADFGRGGTFLAAEAHKRGMIDATGAPKLRVVNNSEEAQAMNLEELKTKHSAVYQAAVAEGVELGKTGERERVCAHIKMGTTCKAVDVAHAAIKDGTEFSATVTADYMSALAGANDAEALAGDSDDAERGTEGAASAQESEVFEDQVAAALAQNSGNRGI